LLLRSKYKLDEVSGAITAKPYYSSPWKTM
jgi:hypothetical protein